MNFILMGSNTQRQNATRPGHRIERIDYQIREHLQYFPSKNSSALLAVAILACALPVWRVSRRAGNTG
jgi:hypothetical protein